MRPLRIIVPAGQAFEANVRGDYVRVHTSQVELTIESPQNSEESLLSQGDDTELSPFTFLRISHASGIDQPVILMISTGKKAGSSKVGGAIAADLGQGAMVQGRASVTNANQALLASKSDRRYLLIQNNDLSAVLRVTVDGSPAAAGEGFRVDAGDSFELPTYCASGAINACMETATGAADNVEFVEA